MSSGSSPEHPRDDSQNGQGKHKKPKHEALRSMIARKKQEMKDNPVSSTSTSYAALDPYNNAESSKFITRGKTGYVCDFDVQRHSNLWDPTHPECPHRLNAIMEKCQRRGLLDRCVEIDNPLRKDVEEKILTLHTRQHYVHLQSIMEMSLDEMEHEATKFDSVYFNQHTLDSACRAMSSTLNLVRSVAKDKVMNGMAFVRPPGHHAMVEEYNGYCFFNNVAVAAESVIRDDLAKKILIVDIDVHHGQGTQRMFYERKDVLYFSIHRYEYGTFWPNLKESNFNYIGKGDGLGYNINVPLNTTGLEDADYLAIIFYILLPVAYEFNPDLVIVSAGYDAALGCPEGRMKVTPGFYSHLVSLLMGLARGKIAVVLEGGYFPDTLSEGAAMTLKTLLGGPCPRLEPTRNIHPLVTEVICNVQRVLLDYWNCFKVCQLRELSETASNDPEMHRYEISYFGVPDKPPFPTRSCYNMNSGLENKYYEHVNNSLQEKYKAPIDGPVTYVYDDLMLQHTPKVGDVERPERPERLSSIMKIFKEFGLENRLTHKEIKRRDMNVIAGIHSEEYLQSITPHMEQTNDVYVNEKIRDVIEFAASGVVTLADEMMGSFCRSGVAIIRPPGHHAEWNKAMGYCFLNNVAVAARRLIDYHDVKRILIVDFDIHHGNGTQNLFYNTENVLYISIHKDERGKFFPELSRRNFTDDGFGMGKGYNVNIPFNNDKMGDTEYLAVFHNIILPIAYSYAPEVVLVSAGFDAGINDPLGGYLVSPETFGHFILMLKSLAEGRLLLTLEGGYNLTTTSYAMAICTKALLGDPIIMPSNVYQRFSMEAIKTIRSVTEHFKKYYSILKVHKKLAVVPTLLRNVERWVPDMYGVEVAKTLNPEKVHDNDYVEQEMAQFSGSSRP